MKLKLNFLAFIGLVFLVFISCAKEKLSPQNFIDPEFLPHAESFFEYYEAYGKGSKTDIDKFSIRFANEEEISDSTIFGKCSNFLMGDSLILISRYFWENWDEEYHRSVIYHELGHCALQRWHWDFPLRVHSSSSWMAQTVWGDLINGASIDVYSPMWTAYYIDEMFNRGFDGPDWLNIGIDYALSNNLKIDTISNTASSILTLENLPDSNVQVECVLNQNGDFCFQMGKYKIDFIWKSIVWPGQTGQMSMYYGETKYLYKIKLQNIPLNIPNKPFLLTIRIMNGQIYHYINEVLIHNREYVHEENLDISVDCDPAIFDKIIVSKWE